MNRRTTALGFALVLALAACDGGGDSGHSPDEENRPSPSSSSVTTATYQAPGTGDNGTPCPPSPPRTTPDGKPLGDVDGDGAVDQVYLSEGSVGIETSSGVVSELPAGRAHGFKVIGVADANDDGRGEVFVVGKGASGSDVVALARVVVFADCRLAYLKDDSGEGYLFEFGESDAGGKGLGCVDADGDGRSELVSLSFERNGSVVRWRRTVINIDGTTGTIGPTDEGTFRSPQDDDEIALLSDVTCGDNPLDAELGEV